MRTARLLKMTGVNNHLANMETGEGKFSHQYYSCSKATKEIFGHDQVLLTLKTNDPNEWSLLRDLNSEFNGAGFQPW
jgi:hypothetical protein